MGDRRLFRKSVLSQNSFHTELHRLLFLLASILMAVPVAVTGAAFFAVGPVNPPLSNGR